MLYLIILTPLIGILLIILSKDENLIKRVGLISSVISFILSLYLWLLLDNNNSNYQFVEELNWMVNWNVKIGVDGLSILFLVLSTFIIPICIIISWDSIKIRIKEYIISFLVTELILILIFVSMDLLLFYVFFETVLIPMFLIIGVWGQRERKIEAAYKFFLYTLLGSLIMLLGIIIIYNDIGSTDIEILLNTKIDKEKQIILWLSFFCSFAIKVPMVPVHIWLPEAHVEAPTSGSVLLAGILLKLGGYGFLRFSLVMFPEGCIYFLPLIYTISILGIIYTSLTTLRQIDLKKIIAYASVGHMNYVTLGLFSQNMQGIEGSIMVMLSHGFISSGLFISIGIIYDRYKTRIIKYYRGLILLMPIWGSLFLILTLANMGFPGTSSFIGEFLILIGLYQSNIIITILASTGIILGAIYSIWLCNRILFGQITKHINKFNDINKKEILILLPLIILILIFGLYGEILLNSLNLPVLKLLIK